MIMIMIKCWGAEVTIFLDFPGETKVHSPILVNHSTIFIISILILILIIIIIIILYSGEPFNNIHHHYHCERSPSPDHNLSRRWKTQMNGSGISEDKSYGHMWAIRSSQNHSTFLRLLLLIIIIVKEIRGRIYRRIRGIGNTITSCCLGTSNTWLRRQGGLRGKGEE